MKQTVVTLASVATVGSAMLLWKLLTGESRGAVEQAQQVQESQEESKDGLSAEPSYSSYEEAADTTGSFADAEASAGWTNSSSQYADEGNTREVLSPQRSPSRQWQRQLSPVQAPQHDEQEELLGSESYISAASAEDDSQEVFSSPAHSPAKQPIATSPQSREDGVTAAQRSALGLDPPQEAPAACAVAVDHPDEYQQHGSLQQEEAQNPHSMQYEAQDSPSLKQQQQQQAADAQLAGFDPHDAASSSPRHKRSSSSDQITFDPIEPRFGLGGFLGQWDGAGTASDADRRAADLTEQEQQQQLDGDLAAERAHHAAPQSKEQGQAGQHEQFLEEQQQQVSDPLAQKQRLQQRKLQPLNYAAADTALQEQHAMTDSLWASLRTVEIPTSTMDSQASPDRSPSAAGTAPAAGGAAEHADSSDSEDYGQSSLSLPANITSAVGPGTSRSNATAPAAAPINTGHSRQPSRARTNSGSLHGSLGDWPSIPLQASVPSDSTATQQRSEIGTGRATAVTSAKQSYSQPQQEHQPQQQAAAQVTKMQRQSTSAGSKLLGRVPAQQQSVDALPSAGTVAEPRKHAALHQAAGLVQPLVETLPPSRWEHQQQQQPCAEHGRQQQQRVQFGDNSAAQQQAADDLQQPGSLQHKLRAIQQPVGEPQQQLGKQPPQEQQQHQQQQQLLQSEFTVPAPAGNSLNTYHTNSSGRKQQVQLQQQRQQVQQQQLGSDQSDGQLAGATEPGPMVPEASRQKSKPQMLHAAETVDLHNSTDSSSRSSQQQLLTPAAVADRDSSSGCGGEFDPLLADLAAGLTAPRNWRPSRGYQGSMAGAPHSKLSIMTTAADDQLHGTRSSLQRQQQQQQEEDQQHTSSVHSKSGTSSAGSAAAAAAGAGGPWFRLVVSSGPAAGRSFYSRDRTAELVIGRSPLCWASIADQEISGKHACVSWSSTHHCWQVADAGSLNGTSHNGAVISKAGREAGQQVSVTHGDKLDIGSVTSAIVECGLGQRHEAGKQQQHQALGQAAGALDTVAVDRQQKQQQQQGLADPSLPQQQQQGIELPPCLQSNQQQQQQDVDSRYSTWTAGQARPTIASPISSSSSNHRSSMIDSPSGAAAAALYRTHGTAGVSGNGSHLGSSTGSGSKRSSLLQTHYRTGGGLSSAGSSSCHSGSPSCPGGAVLAPLMLLQFLECRIEGAVAKIVGADHRRNQMPCEDVVAWRTPLAHWPRIGLFCVFDGHHSRHASEQAQDLLPRLLCQHLQPVQQQQQHVQPLGQHDEHVLQQQQQQGALLADESAVAEALTASFLETDKQLTCEDGCTATAVLLEGCGDGSVLLRVANVGDSMAVLVDLANCGWRCLTEDHRIAGNAAEAARLSAKNNNVTGGVSTRLYGLNIARMLGDSFLKEQDVGFTAEPYVSEGAVLGPKDEWLVVVASDGLWDVVSQERAAGMAGKIAAERARAAGPIAAGTGAVADSTDSSAGTSSSSDRVESGMQDASGGNSSVAAAVAEALMHAALSLRSKDDISIMVLHVLPAAVAGRKAAAGSVTVSGSI